MARSDCVVEHFLYKMYKTTREPCLFRYARKGKWERIPKRCRDHPSEAKFIHKYPPCDTALHRIFQTDLLRDRDSHFAASNTKASPTAKAYAELMAAKNAAVAALISANEEQLAIRDSLGRTPLHLACMDPLTTAEILDMMINVCPSSSSIPDLENRLPLHYACRNPGITEYTMEKLIAACVSAASHRDSHGRTPLHFACMRVSPSQSSDADNIRKADLLVGVNPVATSIIDNDGMTPLHRLCRYIKELYECRYITELYELDQVMVESVGLIEILLQPNPSIVLQPDFQKETPFSIMCDVYRHSEDTVSIKEPGNIIEIPDWHQLMQIILILVDATTKSQANCDDDRLVKGYELHNTLSAVKKQVVSVRDTERNTHDFDPVAIAVVKMCPGQVCRKDSKGNLPLHIAASTPQQNSRLEHIRSTQRRIDDTPCLIDLLVQAYPKAASVETKDGKLPLALAVESGFRWKSGVRTILLANPAILSDMDANEKLFPQILSKIARDHNLDSMYNLTRNILTLCPNFR